MFKIALLVNTTAKGATAIFIACFLLLIAGRIIYKNVSLSKQHILPPLLPIEKFENGKIRVKYPVDFTLVLVGDSMTEALGNSVELRENLKKYYPGKTFEVLNYGFGSTNILSLPKTLEETTFYRRDFRPILEIEFDLILIESFGHNPLSEYPLEDGLKKQEEVLGKALEIIKKENPKAKTIFITPLAPSKKNYAKLQVELSADQRKIWVEERENYIKNHIKFARDHNLPIINIFEKSLNWGGKVNMDYIRKEDYIHPSPKGIIFISKEIARFIYENKILE